MTLQALLVIGLLLWCFALTVLLMREMRRCDRMRHKLLEILREMTADSHQQDLFPQAYRDAVSHYSLAIEGVVNESD